MTFSEVEEYLLNIPRFTSKNEPEKTRAFLEEIGDFSDKIPTIHIAGTNGKGSVCAYLRSAFMENGLNVCTFISPHLVNIRERFTYNNEMISEREFINTFKYIQLLIGEIKKKPGFEYYHPTFFEFLFFMAAVWFKQKCPDVIVLETGLGGRLDATNSISKPSVTIITEIGLDHVEYLGNTKEEIAFEKAGIIKEGVPVVFWSKKEGYDSVILKQAKERFAPSYIVSRENIKNYETCERGIDFLFQSLYDEFVKLSLNTYALYQMENASLAYRALEVISHDGVINLDLERCRTGISCMYWPGRMERVGKSLVIDGAHNEDGIVAFLDSVKNDGAKDRVLLYSAVADKDVELVTSLIIRSGLFRKIYVCKLSGYRAAEMDRLKAAFASFENASFCENVEEGIGEMMREKGASTLMYVAGSLYLVGEVKALIEEEFYND